MRPYVSFKELVSNGGFPTSSVYLYRGIDYDVQLFKPSRIQGTINLHDAPNGPDINFIAMPSFLQYFWGNVIRSATQSPEKTNK